ncbi:MAG: RNA methyltransferase [Roseivirga sp.]|nr:RNA methyltransferase [Roseivirga sp.]
MLSKRLIKYFKSLQLKKYRRQERKFLVEGAKGVTELLKSGLEVEYLLLTADFKRELESELSLRGEVIDVNEKELVQAGTFQSNNAGLGIASMPENTPLSIGEEELVIALDDIRDPGNLGTIIRIADWYGISKVICSKECADVFNPKVVNASMGSFARVQVWYEELSDFLPKTDLTIYGALLEGENIYQSQLEPSGILLMGNESKGIQKDLIPLITQPVHIPRRGEAESLNVSVATAVILDNFFR